MKILLFVFISIICLASCKGKEVSNANLSSSVEIKDTLNIKPKLFHRGYYIKKHNEKSNDRILDSLEGGYDSLQLRIWEIGALYEWRKLYVLKCKDGNWDGMFYFLSPDTNYSNGQGDHKFLSGPEPLDLKIEKAIVPKKGWPWLMDSLNKLKITELPDFDDIPGMEFNASHASALKVEIAKKNYYRWYRYFNSHRFADRFWQAENAIKILRLLEDVVPFEWPN